MHSTFMSETHVLAIHCRTCVFVLYKTVPATESLVCGVVAIK
jgi:hypothetical protein